LRRPTIYEFLNNLATINGDKIKIRHKRLQDAINEYLWRQDDELSRLDASTPLTGSFQEYIHWYAEDHGYSNNSCILAIETFDGIHIGNFGCFNIDDINKQLEIGIMIGNKSYWNHGYGMDAMMTMVDHLFNNTHAERISLKTLDWNIRAQKCFEKCGFLPCGKLVRGDYNFILMEMRRQGTSNIRQAVI
jgi:ribosomal-protein-alanine N-acetyltransferase